MQSLLCKKYTRTTHRLCSAADDENGNTGEHSFGLQLTHQYISNSWVHNLKEKQLLQCLENLLWVDWVNLVEQRMPLS